MSSMSSCTWAGALASSWVQPLAVVEHRRVEPEPVPAHTTFQMRTELDAYSVKLLVLVWRVVTSGAVDWRSMGMTGVPSGFHVDPPSSDSKATASPAALEA